MDTNNRKNLIVDLANTAGIIAVLLAVFLAWRTLAGQDDGVRRFLAHFF